MVAPSYQHIGWQGDPYIVNGKEYVTLKNGRRARWYDDAEFKKAFPKAAVTVPSYNAKTLRQVLGFGERGFIYILKGETYENKDNIHLAGGRYHKIFGWYFIEGIEVPNPLPEGVEACVLQWDDVSENGEDIKSDEELKKVVNKILYPVAEGEFAGKVGDRLSFKLTITAIHEIEDYYGKHRIYHFKDDANNSYLWSTSTAHDWQVNDIYNIKGTIKSLTTIEGKNITVLTRCVKEKN